MKKLFSIILVLLLMLSCSDEKNITEPKIEETDYNEITSKNIGTEGGELKTDEISIIIPPGTFLTNSNLKLLSSDEEKPFGQNQMSTTYKISGLPTYLNNSIKITLLKHSKCLLAIGNEGFSTSQNISNNSFQIFNPVDTTTNLVFELPKTSADFNSLQKINDETISVNFMAIVGYNSYVTPNKHFKISYPTSALNDAYDLGDYLETAYTKIKDLGFDFTRRTNWPVSVTIKKLDNSVYGYSYNSVWGDNYGYLEFNWDKLSDSENMKVTAGHEFFHLVQSLYDSRNSYSKAKFASPSLWFDEAVAVWSEKLFSGSSTFVSPIFADNAYEIISGAQKSTSDAQSYGYGMAGLIKYITNKNGSSILVKIYENIFDGDKPFEAINSVLSSDIDIIWPSFLKQYFEFSIYNGGTFSYPSLLSAASISSQKFTINGVTDTIAVYKKNYNELSAKVFAVENRFDQLDPKSQITFKISGKSLFSFLLFKVSSTQSVLLNQSFDSLTIDNFKKITDEGFRFVAVVVHNNLSSSFSSTSEETFEIKIKQVKNVEIEGSAVGLYFDGTYNVNDGGVNSTIQETGFIGNQFNNIPVIEGNKITHTYVDSDYDRKLEIEFDNIQNPKLIKSFYSHHFRIQDFGSNENEVLVGKNIPLEYSSSSGQVTFSISGNVTSNITQMSYSYEYKTSDINYYYLKVLDSYSLTNADLIVTIRYK
ncbi:MAG: hypothetical protein IPM32_08075 [Ignavibacteriae bacterium]|nr:hypothetical protein [Ignavibacteriota bacterium]